MNTLKTIMNIIIRFATFGLGWSCVRVFLKDYATASWILLIVSFVFLIGYLIERWA